MTRRTRAGGPVAGPDATQRGVERPTVALAVIAGALGLDIGGLNIVNAAGPELALSLGLDTLSLHWVTTIYAAFFGSLLLFGGRVADALGRRRVFITGVAVFTGAAVVAALAPNTWVLIAARAAQGAGAALSAPAALGLLTEVFTDPGRRRRAYGVYAAVGAASGSGGFVLGGVLTQVAGWRSVFAVLGLAGAGVLVAARAVLPVGGRRAEPLGLVGAVLMTVGLAGLVIGVSEAAASGWGAATVGGVLLALLVLLTFVAHETRSEYPLLPWSLARSRGVRAGATAACGLYTAAVGLQYFAPLYLQQVLDYSPLLSGFAVVPLSSAVFLTATYLGGPLLDRTDPRTLLVLGLGVVAVGVGSWSLTTVTGDYVTQMLPGLLVAGAGIGLVFPAMTAVGLQDVPEEHHALSGAVNVTAQQLGASLGVVALVVLAATRTPAQDGAASPAGVVAGYHAAYQGAAAVCLLAAAVCWVVLRPRVHTRPQVTDDRPTDEELV